MWDKKDKKKLFNSRRQPIELFTMFLSDMFYLYFNTDTRGMWIEDKFVITHVLDI